MVSFNASYYLEVAKLLAISFKLNGPKTLLQPCNIYQCKLDVRIFYRKMLKVQQKSKLSSTSLIHGKMWVLQHPIGEGDLTYKRKKCTKKNLHPIAADFQLKNKENRKKREKRRKNDTHGQPLVLRY